MSRRAGYAHAMAQALRPETASPLLGTSELRARVFDEMLDAVLVADDQRRYVDANAAACTLLGRSREEILSLRIEDIMPTGGDIEQLWRQFLSAGTQSGEVILKRGEEQIVVDYRARARVAPHRHVSVLRDISSTVAAARKEERLRAILDELLMAAPIGFALLDRDLRFQVVNPVLAEINGLPAEAHIGKTPMDLLPGVSSDFVRRSARTVFDTGKPLVDVELVGETPAQPGVVRTWAEHWFPVRVHGDIIGVGVIVDEVTDKRRSEAQARDAVELRKRLMAIVSHDLKNPLSAIAMAANLIGMKRDAPAEVHGLANRILSSSRRMQRLVEQLLDFVRVDQAGGIGLDRTPVDLGIAAQRVADELGLAFPHATVRIQTKGSAVGQWDEDRVLQVLSNLISNAIEHGDREVDVGIDGTRATEVRIDVSNSGSPIAPELLEIIFDPFRRAGGGYARRAGLGLGLFITKSIVESHRGSIVARSDDTGTCFSVTLPRR